MTEKFRLTNMKKVHTPMDPNVTFTTNQCPSTVNQVARMKGIPYAKAIGSVLWPTVVSRPDTAYDVGILLQFIQNLGPAHWEGVKRLISYMNKRRICGLPLEGPGQSFLMDIATPIGQVNPSTLNFELLFSLWDRISILELKETEYRHLIEYRIGVRRGNPCCEGRDLAWKLCQWNHRKRQ